MSLRAEGRPKMRQTWGSRRVSHWLATPKGGNWILQGFLDPWRLARQASLKLKSRELLCSPRTRSLAAWHWPTWDQLGRLGLGDGGSQRPRMLAWHLNAMGNHRQ